MIGDWTTSRATAVPDAAAAGDRGAGWPRLDDDAQAALGAAAVIGQEVPFAALDNGGRDG